MKISFILLISSFSGLFTGCMNLDYDPARSDDFDWVNQNSSVDIALDYYKMRTRSDTRLTTMECPIAWSYGRIDPRVIENYEEALMLKGLSLRHIALIQKGEICVGMRDFGLYAAWGRPHKNNTHQSAYGKYIQHIYGSYYANSKHLQPKYVYTQNGTITSFSETK